MTRKAKDFYSEHLRRSQARLHYQFIQFRKKFETQLGYGQVQEIIDFLLEGQEDKRFKLLRSKKVLP